MSSKDGERTDELLAQELEAKLKVTSEKEEGSEARKGSNKKNETAVPEILRKIAAQIESVSNILVLTGAGVSVAAGIPDFRTPGTGLYDNLRKYNLPYAEAVFDIDFYKTTPQPFVQLASELWPDAVSGNAPKPTLTHSFVALLHDKKKLLRNYSQNIDGLEHMADLPDEKLIECHGHFRTASCIRCKAPADIDKVRTTIVTLKQAPTCLICNDDDAHSSISKGSNGKKKQQQQPPPFVKPDIVFFGEKLPLVFYKTLPDDLKTADLCLVLGTSLQVPPVARIPNMVDCPIVLLNREFVGRPDLFHDADCDDSIRMLAQLLGWEEELTAKHEKTKAGSNKSYDATEK